MGLLVEPPQIVQVERQNASHVLVELMRVVLVKWRAIDGEPRKTRVARVYGSPRVLDAILDQPSFRKRGCQLSVKANHLKRQPAKRLRGGRDEVLNRICGNITIKVFVCDDGALDVELEHF